MRTREFQRILKRVRDEILEELRVEGFYYKHQLRHDPTTWDINNGYCEAFAEDVCEQVPEATWDWIEDLVVEELGEEYEGCYHAVIVFKGRYYDAECIEGVSSIKDIPVVKNVDRTREEVLSERQEQTMVVSRTAGRTMDATQGLS